MTHAHPIPRQMLEEYVEYLATRYPKCFFVDPRMRRPLKKNIIADLQKDRVLDDEKIEAATSFYTNHFGYQYLLVAGVERVDLNGDKAGTVTEQEQINAVKKIKADKQKLNGRDTERLKETIRKIDRDIDLPATILSRAPVALKDATLMKKPESPKVAAPRPTTTLERLQTLVADLTDIRTEDEQLRAALTSTTLAIIIIEAQKLKASIEGTDSV